MRRRPVPLTALAVLLVLVLIGATACSSSGDGGTEDAAADPAGGGSTTTSAGGPSGTFDLLSYNVAGLPEGLSGSEPAENMPLIGPRLNDYDLVVLQETWKTPDPNPLAPLRVYHEELESRVDLEYRSESATEPLGTDDARPGAILADGLNVFSRFPLGEVDRHRWEGCFGGLDDSDGGAGDCMAEKGFLVTTVTLAPGVEVDLYDLHGEAGGTDRDQALQADDYDQLAAFIEEHSAGRAVILAGDTNLHTDDPVDPEFPEGEGDLAIWQAFLERTGLTDACTALDCGEPGSIDKAAFRSDGGVTLEVLAHDNPTEDFTRDDGQPLSDHPPLAVRFGWSASAP